MPIRCKNPPLKSMRKGKGSVKRFRGAVELVGVCLGFFLCWVGFDFFFFFSENVIDGLPEPCSCSTVSSRETGGRRLGEKKKSFEERARGLVYVYLGKLTPFSKVTRCEWSWKFRDNFVLNWGMGIWGSRRKKEVLKQLSPNPMCSHVPVWSVLHVSVFYEGVWILVLK